MNLNTYLKDLSSNLIIRDSEKKHIKKSLIYLESKLNSYFEDKIKIQESFCFGSYTRETILPRKADENSDIDYMVVFENRFENSPYSPETLFKYLREFVKNTYSRSEVFRDFPTIVLELNHIKFELVPAYKDFFSYYIPGSKLDYDKWITTNPNEFNNILTNVNKRENFLIKPLIRILKYLNALNDYIYSSYELENYITNLNFGYFTYDLSNYFFIAIDYLPTYNLSFTNKNKIDRIKSKVSDLKYLYSDEEKVKRIKEILPDIY